MARLIFTDEAKHDLLGIRQYTEKRWGKAQAKTYLQDIRSSLHLLSERPNLASKRDEDLGAGVLSYPCGSHMIYFQIEQDDLLVLAILHQNMVPERHLSLRP